MNLIKTLLILLNLELAFGTESVQSFSKDPDSKTLKGSRTVVKRSLAYKRLPGWKVFYGKRSSDVGSSDVPDLYTIPGSGDFKDLLGSPSDDVQPTDTDIPDSVNLGNAGNDVNGEESTLSDRVYKTDNPNANLFNHVPEYKNQQTSLDTDKYSKDGDFEVSKREGWSAIYGKRMPGWFVGYGKRDDSNNDIEKRASKWLAMYGKRFPQWLATYGKRAPQWLATYGKRSPHWLSTYGKRAPQWLATYGKRAPQWLATYGKRSPEWFDTYDKRAPQWLATYGKRAPQWLATYGKRAPRWLATYGKRSDYSEINTLVKHLSALHKLSSRTDEIDDDMLKQIPLQDGDYDKRGNRGWSALYG